MLLELKGSCLSDVVKISPVTIYIFFITQSDSVCYLKHENAYLYKLNIMLYSTDIIVLIVFVI